MFRHVLPLKILVKVWLRLIGSIRSRRVLAVVYRSLLNPQVCPLRVLLIEIPVTSTAWGLICRVVDNSVQGSWILWNERHAVAWRVLNLKVIVVVVLYVVDVCHIRHVARAVGLAVQTWDVEEVSCSSTHSSCDLVGLCSCQQLSCGLCEALRIRGYYLSGTHVLWVVDWGQSDPCGSVVYALLLQLLLTSFVGQLQRRNLRQIPWCLLPQVAAIGWGYSTLSQHDRVVLVYHLIWKVDSYNYY